jgi:hypothetical protein
MATPQQKFYQNNREKVLAYKKEHYAKKSNKKVFDLFKQIQLKGKTKSESRRIIKTAIDAGRIAIKCITPYAQHRFDECGIWERICWTPESWIDNKHPPIRTDQNTIVVEYIELETLEQNILIILEPWMLEDL